MMRRKRRKKKTGSQYDEEEEEEEEEDEEEEEEEEEEVDIPSVKKSPSNYSSMSYELYVEQRKGEQDDNKEEASQQEVWEKGDMEGNNSRRESNNTNSSLGPRKASLSLPGSPYHRRLSRASQAGSHTYSWRSNGYRFGERKQWLRSSYLDTRDHLPYMDDSRVGSPNGSLDGGVIHLGQGWPLGPNSRHNSYSSHTSRVTYNSHRAYEGRGLSRTSLATIRT